MARKFNELRNKMSAQSQEKSQEKAKKMIKEIETQMVLKELQEARGLSQLSIAKELGIQQPAVANVEQRTDMYIAILRNHIEAMGGNLEITANFPNGSVKIAKFSELNCVN